MNCTQIDQYLDAMMDGSLDANDLNSIEDHCQSCAGCAEKLKINRQMMGVFAEMAPEMDVPLTAQAAWRGAVKREADKVKQRRLYRFAGGIAAALVVAIGATFALRIPARNSASLETAEMADEFMLTDAALIEADGAAGQIEAFNETADAEEPENKLNKVAAAPMSVPAPMFEIEMIVDDVGRVCDYAQDLVIEYEGEIDIQHFDEDGVACANLYIDLPAANAAEFVEAIRHFDRSDAALDAMDIEGETSLLLVLKSK